MLNHPEVIQPQPSFQFQSKRLENWLRKVPALIRVVLLLLLIPLPYSLFWVLTGKQVLSFKFPEQLPYAQYDQVIISEPSFYSSSTDDIIEESSSVYLLDWDKVRNPDRIDSWLSGISRIDKAIRPRVRMWHRPRQERQVINDKNWGLGRISFDGEWLSYIFEHESNAFRLSSNRRNNLITANDSMPFYIDALGGLGVDVYVLDTGINIHHREFGGRAQHGKNFVIKETSEDLNGHGTHVAGIIGAGLYGVAKETRLISVKVLDQRKEGFSENITQAIQWVMMEAEKSSRPSLIHLSAIVDPDAALDRQVMLASQAGIGVITAAGNQGDNACNYSPARSKFSITVSGIDSQNRRPRSMSWGECVDLYAPGKTIFSTFTGSESANAYRSGSSMAAPYVTGIAAVVLSHGFDLGSCSEILKDESKACVQKLYDYLKQIARPSGKYLVAHLP